MLIEKDHHFMGLAGQQHSYYYGGWSRCTHRVIRTIRCYPHIPVSDVVPKCNYMCNGPSSEAVAVDSEREVRRGNWIRQQPGIGLWQLPDGRFPRGTSIL